jgi:competence protein ComEA
MKLAGVGAGGAQKIIDYRDAHGPFKKAQDLEKVDGIGKGVIEKNAGRIVVK